MWMSSLLVKTKTPLSHQRDKGANLCGTTLLAGKAQRSGHSGMPGNGGGPEGPTAVSALCSKGIFPASSRPPCTKRRLSVRLGGGYLAFSAHSCDILSYLIRFPAACQEFLLPIFLAWGILALAEGTGGLRARQGALWEMESPRRFAAPPLTKGAFGRVWDPPLRKYRKLSGKRRRGRSQIGPPITDHVRCSTAGASPSPTKDGRSKKWEEAFQSGRPGVPPLRRRTDRERWFGNARRRSGTATAKIFAGPGPSGPAGI